jgi:hypothetical protein
MPNLYAPFYGFLSNHLVDFTLRSVLVGHVVKQEILFFIASLHHELILLILGHVHTLLILGTRIIWFETNNDLHLFLFVISTGRSHYKLNIFDVLIFNKTKTTFSISCSRKCSKVILAFFWINLPFFVENLVNILEKYVFYYKFIFDVN